MRKTFLLGSVLSILLLGLVTTGAAAQETMRAAIPLFSIAAKRSLVMSQRTAIKKFVKAFADATRYLVDNKEGTMRPLIQLLNSNDAEVTDFAYQYLHANSEATLYPPEKAVKNLIRMSAYMDKKLGSINANRFMDLSILDELGTKRNQQAPR